CFIFFFSSRRRHTRFSRDWSSDVCSSDLTPSIWLRCRLTSFTRRCPRSSVSRTRSANRDRGGKPNRAPGASEPERSARRQPPRDDITRGGADRAREQQMKVRCIDRADLAGASRSQCLRPLGRVEVRGQAERKRNAGEHARDDDRERVPPVARELREIRFELLPYAGAVRRTARFI